MPAATALDSPPPEPRVRSRRAGRQLLLRLHFYAGVFVGPFLLVAALSGALYALTPQLERLVHADALTGTTVEQPLSLERQVALAQEAVSRDELPAAVRPAADGGTTRVMFSDPALGASEHRAVFVDPGTGRVTGDLTVYGTSGALPLRTTLDQLHRSLLLGEPGRVYSELAASWLWVLALSGPVLWALRRRGRRGFLRDARGPNAYRRALSWHSAAGVWLAVGLLFLSATGLTWSARAGANVGELRAALGWSTPVVSTELGTAPEAPAGGEHTGHGEHAGHTAAEHGTAGTPAPDAAAFDTVLAAGRDAGVDAELLEITPAAEAGSAWTVAEIDRSWPTQADVVAVDPVTGTVVDEVRFADYSLPAKLARWGIDAHTGVLFGVLNQLVLVVLALGLAAMVGWGYLMWWRRRPVRATGLALGAAPARGALRRMPVATVAGLGAVAVLVGTFLPLLGISLLGFLLLDALLAVRRRRGRTRREG